MMTLFETGHSNQLEIHLSGQISASDYDDVFTPAIEAALAEHDSISALVVFDAGFEGYDMAAAWADTRMGLSHWRGFDRVAVASDVGWVNMAARAFAPLAPCPVQIFGLSEVGDARRWLRESLGSIHVTELGGPAVQVQLLGKLDPPAYARAQEALDAHLQTHDPFNLLLDLREFDGWQGISALAAHFSLARDHAPRASRVGIVGDKAWQRVAERVGSKFLNAETRFFEADQLEAAKAWVTV